MRKYNLSAVYWIVDCTVGTVKLLRYLIYLGTLTQGNLRNVFWDWHGLNDTF